MIVLPRECTKNIHIRDELITPDDEILIPLWLQHRHVDKWDKPMEFDPYRFYKKKSSDVCPAYMPFGKGDRVCIGSAFAKQEAMLILSRIIIKFSLQNISKDIIPLGKITLKPSSPVEIIFNNRDK